LKGDKAERDEAINYFSTVANSEVQELNLTVTREQQSGSHLLLNVIEMLDECRRYSDGSDLYAYLYYDTYNNLARIQNYAGTIEGSLFYLLKALDYTKYLSAQDPSKAEDLI
jgi:hypothetical protein